MYIIQLLHKHYIIYRDEYFFVCLFIQREAIKFFTEQLLHTSVLTG
jgi:hypothetical protein